MKTKRYNNFYIEKAEKKESEKIKLLNEIKKAKEKEYKFYEKQTTLFLDQQYSQNWHKYNLAKTHEKRLFYELLSELRSIIPEEPYVFGRPPAKIKDLFFMCCLKIYSNYSSRKIDFDLKNAEGSGYIKKACHYNRLSEFLNSPLTYELLQKLLTITAIPMKKLEEAFSMDASGFGSYQYQRWKTFRFSPAFMTKATRNYLKAHVCIGTRTNVVCTAEITYGNFSDISQAPKLLNALGKNFKPKEVSGDKGYSAYRVLKIIERMKAMPFIAFKDNTNPTWKSPEIWIRMYSYFKNHPEKFLKSYHKRSNVETTFSMIKMRLGEFLKSKNYEAQRNELLIKLIVHNICCLIQEIFENNIHVDFKKSLTEYTA